MSLAVFYFGDFGGRCKGGPGAAVLIGAARRANRVVLKAEDGGMVAGFGMLKQDAFAVIGLAGHNRQAVILPQVDPGAVERGGFLNCDCALACHNRHAQGIFQIAVDGTRGNFRGQAGRAAGAEKVVVEDLRRAVDAVNALDIVQFGARLKACAPGQRGIGRAQFKPHNPGAGLLVGTAGGFGKRFNGAHFVGRGLNRLEDVGNPAPLAGLDRAVPHKTGYGAAHGVARTAKLRQQDVFAGQQLADRVGAGLDAGLERLVNSKKLLLWHAGLLAGLV